MPPRKKRKAADDAAAAADSEPKRYARRAYKAPQLPPSINLTIKHAALGDHPASTIARILSNPDGVQAASALNCLLKASCDEGANYCLGPGGEKIMAALVKLFDEAIGWEEKEDGEEEEGDGMNSNLDPSMKTWDAASLSGKHRRWRDFCRERLASPLASSSDPSKLIDPAMDAPILHIIVAILRNLSFVAQNLRFLYHSEGILRILTGAMYYRGYSAVSDRAGEDAQSSRAHQSNMCVHAVQTLTNLAPLIDITGRQVFIDKAFLESDAKEITYTVPDQKPPSDAEGAAAPDAALADKDGYSSYGISSFLGFGGMHLAKQYDTKAETLNNIPNSVVFNLVGSHVRTTLAIFPALFAILDPNDVTTTSTAASGWHRPSVQAVLEFLTALIEVADNKAIFLGVPDAILHRLTDLLYMPRLGPDSMDYVDPVGNTVSRVVALKLTMGYDATVDADLRDRACELLVKLTDLSTSLKVRLGMAPSISGMARRQYQPLSSSRGELAPSILRSDETSSSRQMNVRLYDSLLSMVSAASGKGDAGPLATRLLANLALVPENKAGIMYVERKVLAMSSKDPAIANVACNGVFNRI
ncbi:hypothetical protein ACHAXT_010261 [Thalassiosira profunda]